MGQHQTVTSSPLTLRSRRIDSVSLHASDDAPVGSGAMGKVNVANGYEGPVAQPDGSTLYGATVTVEVSPESGRPYYTCSIKASALFGLDDETLSEADVERSILSFGVTELYGYVKEMAALLTQGGVYGEMMLPSLSFGFAE